MIRNRFPGIALFVGLIIAATYLLHGGSLRSTSAGDTDRIRLLVKCNESERASVLAALSQVQAEVWDLRTMKILQGAGGPVPHPRDAGHVMEEIFKAVNAMQSEASVRITSMSIGDRKAVVQIMADSEKDMERVRQALRGNAYLKDRVKDVAVESSTHRPTANIRTSFSLHFDTMHRESGAATPLRSIDRRVIMKICEKHGLEYQSIGPEENDPNRLLGYRTTATDWTFSPTTLVKLRALIADLAGAQPGLTILGLRWRLEQDGRVLKPVVRVGGRTPLGR